MPATKAYSFGRLLVVWLVSTILGIGGVWLSQEFTRHDETTMLSVIGLVALGMALVNRPYYKSIVAVVAVPLIWMLAFAAAFFSWQSLTQLLSENALIDLGKDTLTGQLIVTAVLGVVLTTLIYSFYTWFSYGRYVFSYLLFLVWNLAFAWAFSAERAFTEQLGSLLFIGGYLGVAATLLSTVHFRKVKPSNI